MVSVLNDSSDINFFPPGSLESHKDSQGTAEFPSFQVFSPTEDSSNSKNIIDYIEAPLDRKLTPKNRITKAAEDFKTPGEKTQKFNKRDKELWKESWSLNESIAEEDTQKELSLLRMQLKTYQELVTEYESSLKVLKSILEGVKKLTPAAVKAFPPFDETSIKSARQSLESISLYINNTLAEKAKKHFAEPKRIRCLKLDNVYPSILIPESPEPPKANLNKRQNSVVKEKTPDFETSDKKKRKNFQDPPKAFKSVSPILKTKYKPIIAKPSKL